MRARFLVIAVLAGLSLAGCGPSKEDLAAKQAAISANKTAGVGFLAENAKQPGVVTLPSGLQYKVTTSGAKTAPSPKEGDIIKVHYEGKLLDGTVFDSSFERGRPMIAPLAGLVPAWQEALPKMKVGDEWTLFVPPALGYGDREAGPIPPNSVMIFRVKLIDMMTAD